MNKMLNFKCLRTNRATYDTQLEDAESYRTVIWVSPCFGYPRTQITSDLDIPSRDTQNTESDKYRTLGQVWGKLIAHWGKLFIFLRSFVSISGSFLSRDINIERR